MESAPENLKGTTTKYIVCPTTTSFSLCKKCFVFRRWPSWINFNKLKMPSIYNLASIKMESAPYNLKGTTTKPIVYPTTPHWQHAHVKLFLFCRRPSWILMNIWRCPAFITWPPSKMELAPYILTETTQKLNTHPKAMSLQRSFNCFPLPMAAILNLNDMNI